MSESVWLQGQPRSGEAPLDEAGLVLDLLQAVPDDLDQMGEAGDGEVGQDAALERRADPFHGVEVGGVGGQLEHPQPWLRAGEGTQGRAGVHVEVVPGQHDVAAGQLAVGGDEDVPVLDPGEGLRLALAPAVAVQPVDEPAAVAAPVAGHPGHPYPPGAGYRLPAPAPRGAASPPPPSRPRGPPGRAPRPPAPSGRPRRHRRTDRSLTRSSTAIIADGTRCSNLSTASSRTRSRRLRPSAVNPPPCAYRIHPAYRQQQDPPAPWTSPIKDLLSASARHATARHASET